MAISCLVAILAPYFLKHLSKNKALSRINLRILVAAKMRVHFIESVSNEDNKIIFPYMGT
jgi:hypothetical protein